MERRFDRLSEFLVRIRASFGLGETSASEPRIREATVTDSEIVLFLTDGRIFTSPLRLYTTLQKTPNYSREQFKIVGRGIGLHWPRLDYDLSLEGILNGVPEHSPDQGDGVHRCDNQRLFH
jgi:hypothetical protein